MLYPVFRMVNPFEKYNIEYPYADNGMVKYEEVVYDFFGGFDCIDFGRLWYQ